MHKTFSNVKLIFNVFLTIFIVHFGVGFFLPRSPPKRCIVFGARLHSSGDTMPEVRFDFQISHFFHFFSQNIRTICICSGKNQQKLLRAYHSTGKLAMAHTTFVPISHRKLLNKFIKFCLPIVYSNATGKANTSNQKTM